MKKNFIQPRETTKETLENGKGFPFTYERVKEVANGQALTLTGGSGSHAGQRQVFQYRDEQRRRVCRHREEHRRHKPEELEAARILADKGYKVTLKNEAGFGYKVKTPRAICSPRPLSNVLRKEAV